MNVWFEGLSLPVSELDRSVSFSEALGFAVEVRTEQFVLLRHGSATLGLLALGEAAVRSATDRMRPFIQVELGTDDLDALHADFLAHGVPVHSAPRDRGFERQMQLRHPDGFTVEFAEGERGHNRTD